MVPPCLTTKLVFLEKSIVVFDPGKLLDTPTHVTPGDQIQCNSEGQNRQSIVIGDTYRGKGNWRRTAGLRTNRDNARWTVAKSYISKVPIDRRSHRH